MCGIAGYLGSNDPSEIDMFSPMVMKYLMLKQDSRGRDNCGIYYRTEHEGEIKDRVEWGWIRDEVGSTQTFKEFLSKRDLMEFKGPHKIIAHSRRGSVGSNSLDNSHPFVVGDVVGVHNGTLHGWRELMKHLEVDITGIECDSEAIFKAFSEGKVEDFLSQYRNAATLVWTEKDSDITYIWCGGSSSYVNGPLKADREFHLWETQGGIYFSSEKGPLKDMQLCMPKDYSLADPYQVDVNTLYTIKNDVIISKVFIERTPYYPTSTYNQGKGNEKRTKEKKGKSENKQLGGNPPVSAVYPSGDVNDVELETLLPSTSDSASFNQTEGKLKEDFPEDWFRLRVYNGRYYRGPYVINSIVGFADALFQNELDELSKRGYFFNRRYFVDQYGYFCHWSDTFKSYIRDQSFGDTSTTICVPRTEITELFFYEGVLIKDEKTMVEVAKMDKNTEGAKQMFLNPYYLMKKAISPVPLWFLPGKKREDNEFLIFQPDEEMGSLMDMGRTKMKNYFIFPHTNKAYKFTNGVPTEVKENPATLYQLQSTDKYEDYANTIALPKERVIYPIYIKGYHEVNCSNCGQPHTFSEEQIKLVPDCIACDEEIVVNPSALEDASPF